MGSEGAKAACSPGQYCLGAGEVKWESNPKSPGYCEENFLQD